MGSAADFISGLPRDLQESFLKYCTSLVQEVQSVRSQLVDSDGAPFDPILIMDACFVAFGEAKENPKLLISPNQQLDELRVRTGMRPSASVFLRDLKAHRILIDNLNDKTAFNALIAEAALELLSGEHALLLQNSATGSTGFVHGSDTEREKPPTDSSTKASMSSEHKPPQATAAQTPANAHSSANRRVFREIDRRPKHREYTGIWDAYSKASIIREPVKMAPSESSKPTASSDRHETIPPKQSMRHAFCAPVIIEGPSPAIGGEKLVEDVGLATSNADFITILDKFSWVPHSRTFRTQLPTPTPKRVTVTFARRKSAFSPECTTLGTFLLTGFSGKDEVANTLEIRVNAIDSGLTFEVRDAAGSNLAITRKLTMETCVSN